MSRAGLYRLGKLAGAGVIFVFLVFLWYAKDLPSPGKINAQISAQTTKFYARDELDNPGHGTLLYELYGDKNRTIIKFDEIPDNVKKATIAIEDKDFYSHGAFSVFGIGRALQGVIFRDPTKGGGSTITQQYVKNALLTGERTYSRKIKELILATEIEFLYNKNDILALYLNEIPYGNRAFGIESACKTYFPQNIDKSTSAQRCAKNLDLGQAALLAAIPNAPSYFSPYGSHQDRLLDRQHVILDQMVKQGYTTREQATAAQWTMADLSDSGKISQVQNLYADIKAPHFVLYAKEFLEGKYGDKQVTEGGLKVITSLDYAKQTAAEKAINDNYRSTVAKGGHNAAIVSTDPKTGQILAMVGSHDFNDPNGGQVNVSTSLRQPGSSFKPFVYATLFGKNKDSACAKTRECPTYGPGTTIYDVPTRLDSSRQENWPQNYGNRTYGVLTARQALAGSLNIPAVKAMVMAGTSSSIQTAKSLGISTLKSPESYGLSLVLGSGEVQLIEMANAYESFANGGQHYEQTPILKLYDQKGGIMEDNTKPKKPKQALDPQVAGLMADVLSDNNAKQFIFGNSLLLKNGCSNNAARNCVHAGAKTGTTENINDAWTMGFTPDLVAGVWVGNNDNSPMTQAAVAIAAPIWKSYMDTVVNGKATEAFAKPASIKTVSLDKTTGRSVTSGTKTTTVDLFGSWYTPQASSGGRSAQVDKVSGKLATECTPELAKDSVYSSAILPEITRDLNPTQYDLWLAALIRAGYTTNSGGDLPTTSDDVHHCDDVQPTVNITGANGGGPYNFNVNVTSGTFTANKLQVYFDDQIISTQQINGSGNYPVSYSATETGGHTFKAVVTDAGLYQANDEQAVTVTNTGGSAGFSGITPSDGSQVSFGIVAFAWAPADGASSYSLYVDNVLRGSTNGTSRNVPGLTPGNHTWYVRADTGDTTPPISFKVNP